jgi:hypothetical protein
MSDDIPVLYTEDQYNKAYQLIGEYFFNFALLERAFHKALRYLFNLPGLKAEMLFANMTFRDKVNALRTAVEFSSRDRKDEWVDESLSTLNRIMDISTERNFLAHTSFFPSKSGGVSFFKVQAKGKFDIPETLWSEPFFKEKYSRLLGYAVAVDQIIDDMQKRDINKQIAVALASPTGGHGLLDLLSHHSPQPQDTPRPTSSFSSSQTDAQTPEASAEKS